MFDLKKVLEALDKVKNKRLISDAELADLMGIGRASLYIYRKGSNPSYRAKRKIVEFLKQEGQWYGE